MLNEINHCRKGSVLYDSVYLTFSERQNYNDGNGDCQGEGGEAVTKGKLLGHPSADGLPISCLVVGLTGV